MLSLLASAACSTAEFGYADVVDGHADSDRVDPPIETVRRAARIFVNVTTYRLPASEEGAVRNLIALADSNVNITKEEAFRRNGVTIFATRPGGRDLIQKRMERRKAVARVQTGVVVSGGTLTLDVAPHGRRLFTLARGAVDGGKAGRVEMDLDGSLVEILPVAAPGGGVETKLTPKLRRVEDPILTWTLPELTAELVVDSERSVVMVPRTEQADRFGSAFLGTAKGEWIVLVITYSIRQGSRGND